MTVATALTLAEGTLAPASPAHDDLAAAGFSVSFSSDGIRDAMVYESAITASCSDTNYSVTWTDGKQSADYTVNTRDISITIDSVEKIYGENDPALAFTFDATELQYSDNVNALGVTLTRASGDNVGNYAISGTLRLPIAAKNSLL